MSLISKFSIYILLCIIGLSSCKNTQENDLAITPTKDAHSIERSNERNLSQEFKDYWYAGKAEITSYQLEQERYGEIRDGVAVNIFVAEDFLPDTQVKADGISEENIPVLKLNNTKKFLTGIYPYSIMTSTFSPVNTQEHAIKISHSMQEWCGHVYMQLNNRAKFDVLSHSYFEGEADTEISLSKTWLENELWNLIRINPDELPTGEISIIPTFEYSRLKHKKIAAYGATAHLKQGDSISIYSLNYPELQREMIFYFNSEFPFEIEKWEEITASRNNDTSRLKTTATKMKRIRSPYWSKNKNKDLILRDSLNL